MPNLEKKTKSPAEFIGDFNPHNLSLKELSALINNLIAIREAKVKEEYRKDWDAVVKALDDYFAKGYDYITVTFEDDEFDLTPESDYRRFDGVINLT